MNKIFLKNILIGLFPILSIVACCYANWCSIGLTYDSYDYLFAADSFKNKGVLLNANGMIFRERTPLFPLILSLFKNNLFFIQLSFALVHSFILYGFLYFHESLKPDRLAQLYLSVLLSFSVPLLLVESFIWSEPYFLLLLSISLYCLVLWCTNKSYTTLLIAATLGFLYCLQRNTGIFFVLGSTLFILSESTNKKGLIHAFLFSTIALFGWFAWTTYHWMEIGAEFQPTLLEIGKNILPNIKTYIESYSVWFFPNTLDRNIRVGLFLVVLFFSLLLTRRTYFAYKKQPKGRIIKLWYILIVCYHIGMLLLEEAVIWEVDRFIAILYPFTALVAVIVITDFLTTKSKKAVITTILVVWLLYPILRTCKFTFSIHNRNCIERN